MNTNTINNELICEQIRKVLYKKKDIIMAICSRNEGFISIFIRNGQVQKLQYQRNLVIADRTFMDAFMDNLDDSEEISIPEQVIPDHVYRRFAYMIASSTLTIAPMDYGHLRFHFNFEKREDDWQESFKMTFDKEYHFTEADFN